MAYRKPFLKVTGPDNQDMLKTWGGALIGVKLVDRQDGESDESIFMFTRKPPYMEIPGQGTPYTVQLGWSADNTAVTGRYTFQRVHIFGEPGQGQQLHLICRAADYIDKLKQADSEHFDKDNGHRTLGEVFNSLFKDSGAQVLIHPDLAQAPLPGDYLLRWRQSPLDFGTDLAESVGGIVKPMDGKILVLKRGSLTSVSGQTLPTILMPFDENYFFDYEFEPRFDYQAVTASYLDTDKGTLEEKKSTGGDGKGATAALPHPYANADAAQRATEAAAAELNSFTGQGTFSKAGDATAVSGAAVKCSDFGTPIDETQWLADCVTHDVIPDKGWTTTVETVTIDGGLK